MRTHLDLFSGIGGFALAAADNGVQTVQFVEIDPRCRAFLAKAWPGVPIHDDIRTFHWGVDDATKARRSQAICAGSWDCSRGLQESERGFNDDRIWLLTGGVPCQPASRAGKQRGEADDRWLWPEAIRVIAEVQPAWALLENPPGIGDVGLAGILAQVEAQGYQVRVLSIPACALGAPHRRERYWIVCRLLADCKSFRRETAPLQDVSGENRSPAKEGWSIEQRIVESPCGLGNAEPEREQRWPAPAGGTEGPFGGGHRPASPSRWEHFVWLPCADGKVRRAIDDTQRMAHGLPVELLEELGAPGRQSPKQCEVHRSILGALGNSIVWPVASEIIRAMVLSEETDCAPVDNIG